MTIQKLAPDDLGPTCDPAVFGVPGTDALEPLDEVVGQERALQALRDGLAIAGDGYNLFVSGPVGSGRRTMVSRIAAEAAARRPAPPWLCYLHDVDDPLQPVPVVLAAGDGPAFVVRVDALVQGSLDQRRALLSELAPSVHSHRAMRALQRMAETDAARLPLRCATVLAGATSGAGAPVVTLDHPTLENLVGRVERRWGSGGLVADVSGIRAGALHRASGGILIVSGAELVRRGEVWESLKRVLTSGHVVIEEPEREAGSVPIERMRPWPAPVDVKVVVIGTSALYYHLLSTDEEFAQAFKVKVELDDRMDRTPAALVHLARFVAGVCRRESLLPVDASGLAGLADHASELAEDRAKLTSRLGLLGDVAREADLTARRDGAPSIGGEHVIKALDARRHRVDLFEERVQEWLTRGTIAVDLSGEVVGQVNGLSVLDLGDHWFARPTRITASLGPGREGVLDIERESELGGPLHTKGMLILQGYLQHLLGWDEPVALRASLCFEQSYGPVDGDSASAAELCAILSALAEVPIRQSIAVTGALSLRGDVQAIGDVSAKVEGFFRACSAIGPLTGAQGVVLPAANREHLLLDREVKKAVAAGTFHVWSVSRVEEALALLTGHPVGEPSPDGYQPRDSILAKAQRRLRLFAERLSRAKE